MQNEKESRQDQGSEWQEKAKLVDQQQQHLKPQPKRQKNLSLSELLKSVGDCV
jgi:hypothetical protein